MERELKSLLWKIDYSEIVLGRSDFEYFGTQCEEDPPLSVRRRLVIVGISTLVGLDLCEIRVKKKGKVKEELGFGMLETDRKSRVSIDGKDNCNYNIPAQWSVSFSVIFVNWWVQSIFSYVFCKKKKKRQNTI